MAGKLKRRKFLQQLALGSLTVPLLLESLTQSLVAQPKLEQQSIVWLFGQSSGINRAGIWNLPGFPDFLEKYFQTLSIDDLQTTALRKKGPQAPILILDGYFSKDPEAGYIKSLSQAIKQSRLVILLGNETAYAPEESSSWIHLEQDLLLPAQVPFIRLPGVPVSARHLLGTLNHLILFGLPQLDELRRPLMFFEKYICERCEYRSNFDVGDFVNYFGEKEGCLYLLGCKGPVTKNTCPVDRWNETGNWCVKAGSPCSGCSDPDYPNHAGLGFYGTLSGEATGTNSLLLRHAENITKGTVAVTAAGILLHALTKKSHSSVEIQKIHTYKGEDI
ncbi:MAG: hypothetical protein COB67_12905 [SAR324 cluster bacterium]|uniref:Cytochrome-c3 hydrogenase C-terminal domain-containing protein n=1 Tax=SAR324 cluster bacterium TaxID=2024889 RepID=A0A2A4SPS9_9DELT|nr:MAG: hypothetical protein COB67_12905 [SAR324 cluster bacterium]